MSKGLGKGLSAFFPGELDANEEQVQDIHIDNLRPNPYQPRKTFSEEAIEELKMSILEHGILQPLIVRKSIKGYDIVVGERRFRAAKAAGLSSVPAVVKELSDEKMMEVALIENLQRENLNPFEEAKAYETLLDRLELTQEELAKRLGKSRPHVANHLRLLQLPESVLTHVANGKLSMGHGRALLGLKNKQLLVNLANKVIEEEMSVRRLEALVQEMNERSIREKKKKSEPVLSPFLRETQDSLRSYFGTNVSIKKGKKKGKIEIDFFSDDDLERILELLERKDD